MVEDVERRKVGYVDGGKKMNKRKGGREGE
jgi:hypothetical protein